MHLAAHLDVDVVALESEDHVTLLLELAAPSAPEARRAPTTVQVVLDRSGSMAGGRIDVAREAIASLIDRLGPEDRFGLVAFDDEVRVVVPARPLEDKAAAAKGAVAGLGPGGMTNLSGGLLRGLQEARRVAGGRGGTVLLLSDGHANVGELDHDRLGSVSAKARADGITVSTLGLGLDYDEALLASLARGGAGNAHFAEEADTAGAQLASEIDGLLNLTAQAASVLVAPGPGVQGVTVWNDVPGQGTADGIMLELGDFVADETRKLVLDFDVPAAPALGLAQIAEITLRWASLPELEEHTISLPVHVNVVPGDEAAGRMPDAVVRSELAFQRAQKRKREAAEALRQGRTDDAGRLFAEGADVLASAAAAAPDAHADELRAEAELLADAADRASWDDHRRVAKWSEADSGWKSRKRGRGDGR